MARYLPGSTSPGRPGRSVSPLNFIENPKLNRGCRSNAVVFLVTRFQAMPDLGRAGSARHSIRTASVPATYHSSSSKAETKRSLVSTLSWTQLDYTSDGQEHQCHNEWRQTLRWCKKATKGKSARHVGRNSSLRLGSAGITQRKITAKKPNEL